MKAILTALVLVTFTFGVGAGHADPNAIALINARCQKKWGDDFRMQRHCRDKQTAAMLWVGEFVRKHKIKPGSNDAKAKALTQCWTKWSEQDNPDWRMVKYCTEKQIEAYNTLD